MGAISEEGRRRMSEAAHKRWSGEHGREQREGYSLKFSGVSKVINSHDLYPLNNYADRTCLKCSKTFRSYGKQNRTCPQCLLLDEFQVGYQGLGYQLF